MIDALTLDQLRVFVAIAETGSFSAAAKRLRRVQSAISHSVRSMETTLGLELFNRAGRVPAMTEVSKALLPEAYGLIGAAAHLRAKAMSLADGVEPELALAVDPLFPTPALIRALREVERSFPSTTIRLVTEGICGPEKYLRRQAVSLAIYSLETTEATDLEAIFLGNVDLIPVVASQHPLAAKRRPLSRADLGEATQLVLSNDAAPGWSRGVLSSRVWHFADLHTRLEFLLAGFGWCNMPESLVLEAVGDGRLSRLDIQENAGFRLSLQVVHLKSYSPGPCARLLIRLLSVGADDGRRVSQPPA